jgi:CRISPR/Cas system CSM-associated protein Csm3 (group 7 of RAMP superfamily)
MITNKIIYKANIILLSPLLIGNGENENSDCDVLVDEDGTPFIPATSFVGVVRNVFSKLKEIQPEYYDKFFGFSDNDEDKQSDFRCSDLRLISTKKNIISIRDGIRIDNNTGLTVEHSKFDYEVLNPDAIFKFNFEFDLCNDDNNYNNFKLSFLNTLIDTLQNQTIRFGSKTNNGFGLVNCSGDIHNYNFKDIDDVDNYLNNKNSKTKIKSNELPKAFNLKANFFEMDIHLKIKNSIIIRDYNSLNDFDADTTNIKCNGKNILPGSSFKGVLRATATKILNKLGIDSTDFINNLFGFVDENSKTAKKGRLAVKESYIENVIPYKQTRIKIDRFTGAAIESALFDSQALFPQLDTENIVLNIKLLEPSDAEIGLLLLVLREIYTGKVAFGGEKNIGRGYLEGLKADIKINDASYKLDNKNLEKSVEELDKLNVYVQKINNYEVQNV